MYEALVAKKKAYEAAFGGGASEVTDSGSSPEPIE